MTKFLLVVIFTLCASIANSQTVADVPQGARFQFIWDFTQVNLTADKVQSFWVRIDNNAPVSSNLAISGGTFLYPMPQNLPVGSHTVAVKACSDAAGQVCGLEASAKFNIVAVKPPDVLPRAPSSPRIHVG